MNSTRGEEVKARLKQTAAEVEAYLQKYFRELPMPKNLHAALEYSLLAGGKRLRPGLCLTFAEMFGLERAAVMPFACGFECIHTYSLIHDDLPAMDDDDMRRGKPSSHKKFGEAVAVLAGDGLLTEAFGLMLSTSRSVPYERVVTAMEEAVRAAGCSGMVGGQVLDMEYTGRSSDSPVSLDELRSMHAMKTGALILASCMCGAVLAGSDTDDLLRVEAYGRAVGKAFQIVDDILDETGDEKKLGKPVGSDAAQGKTTYPSLLGLEQSMDAAEQETATALKALEGYSGEPADFLRDLARYVVDRVY